MKTRSTAIIGIACIAFFAGAYQIHFWDEGAVKTGAAFADGDNMAETSEQAAPARDGDIAIKEELDIAVGQDTIAAYEFFIARHPDHPLSDEARARLKQLQDNEDGA